MKVWTHAGSFKAEAVVSSFMSRIGLSKSSGVKRIAARTKQAYKCSQSKLQKCSIEAYVLAHDSGSYDIYSFGKHHHDAVASCISEAFKQKLENCDRRGIAPKQAHIFLQHDGESVRKFAKILLPHLGLTTALLCYISIGAAVFQVLESAEDVEIRSSQVYRLIAKYDQIMNDTWKKCQEDNISRNHWRGFIRSQLLVLSKVHEGDYRAITMDTHFVLESRELESRWTFQAAVLYALTVITTTGYDHVTPQTAGGKLFAVFFGLVGIPLMFITAADIGKFLSEVIMNLWEKFLLFRENIWRNLTRRRPMKEAVPRVEKNNPADSDASSSEQNTVVGHIELPVFAYFGLILLYCAIGGLLYTSWETDEHWTFLHAFHFSFNTITTIGLGNIVVHHVVYMFLIVAYVIIGLAVITMCVDLASSQLKLLFSKIHYFGRKMRTARSAFVNISDDLREAMRVITAIRRHKGNGNGITVDDIRKYLEMEAAHCLQKPFIPQNIHVIRFADDEELSSMLTGSLISVNLQRSNSDPNIHV